jgi:hypothetical protein
MRVIPRADAMTNAEDELSKAGSFLLSFNEDRVADAILHAHPLVGFDLILIFTCYRRQTGTIFKLLRFKILLTVENILVHAWSLETAQAIIGSTCLIFNVAPSLARGEDLFAFWAAAWETHPDLIPAEVGCIFPKLEDPFVEQAPPLFLSASELIHSKIDTLQLRALIKIIEIHDFSPPEGSDDDSPPDSDDS